MRLFGWAHAVPGAVPREKLRVALRVVPATPLSGQAVALVNEADLPGIICPTIGRAAHGRQTVRVTVHLGHPPGVADRMVQEIAAGTVALNRRTRERLDLAPGDEITLEVERPHLVEVRPAQVDDLPAGATLHADPQLIEQIAPGRRRPWVHATCGGTVAAVRLEARPGLGSSVRATLAMRILLGVERDEKIALCSRLPYTRRERQNLLLRRVWRRRRNQRQGAVTAILLGLPVRALRWVDSALEWVLRLVLGAPTFAFRTTQAHPGDDSFEAVRLNGAMFSLLGIEPGGHVFVNWGPSRRVLLALEDHLPHSGQALDSVKARQLVDRFMPPLPSDFPAHLVIRVPAGVRIDLGMPTSSVVQVRRRLRPIVAKHLNVLTVPVAGLVLAAAALPAVRGWPLVIGSVVPLVFATAALRIPRPPRGPWP